MASPKKQMKEARKSYKKDRKVVKKSFRQEKRQGSEVYKQRSKQAEQVFANNPERLRTVQQELKKQYQSEQHSFKTNRRQGFIKAKADFAEQVKSAPLAVLKAKEIKEHRLPDLKQQRQEAKQAYNESKRAFYAAKREARQEAKEARRQKFTYGSEKKTESNFSSRQSNFTAYQSEKSRAKMKEKKAERLIAKEKYKSAKLSHKQAKKTYRFKKNAGINTALLLREASYLMAENDAFSSLRDIEQTVRSTKRYSKSSYKAGKQTVKAGRFAGRFTKNRAVNTVERTKNWRKGKGFVLNNKDRHLNQRIKRFVQKSGKNIVKGVKSVVAFVKNLPTLVVGVVTNPIVWLWIGGLLVFLSVIAMFIEVQINSLIQQDDFELNKSYVHMTYEDAQHTLNDERGTTYYTKIDDVMAYMNYRYGDYELDKNTGLSLISQTYKEYLSDLWEEMNGGESLKSMATLYKDTKSIYFIDEEEQEDLDELKENGVYAGLQELENPFQGQTDDDVLSMSYRFGYYNNSGEVKMNNYIILEASEGQVIIAPTDGKIIIEDDDVIIVSHEGKNFETRLRLKHIADGSVREGQKVLTGDVIGKTSSASGLKVYYQKYNDDKNVQALEYVNPAFYFPRVVQAQTTILPNIGHFQGDEVERAKIVYEFLKAKGASNQFIAGVLGNWSIESQITAKRAEGDYLNPPVGATDTSWDDDNWLNMGGQEIYNGRYPNIKHRGLGLGQWTDTYDGAVRNTLLRNYAKDKNSKWYDLELQLNFMFDGDNPYYTNWVKNNMKNTGSPASMAQLFLIYWEGNSGDKLIERQTAAIEWYYQIENGFTQNSSMPANVNLEQLEKVRDDLYDGVVPGGGDDMGYPYGQCTWGTAKRINQLGLKLKGRDGSKIPIISMMGNGMDWVATATSLGGETGSTPKAGAIISFNFGDPYGHVAFVEKVYEDGSFLISETNFNGSAWAANPSITFRKFSHADSSMSFDYTTK